MMTPCSYFRQTEQSDRTLEDFDDLQILHEHLPRTSHDIGLQFPPMDIFNEMESREPWDWGLTRARPLCMVYCTDDEDDENTSVYDHHDVEIRDQRPIRKPLENVLKDVSNLTVDECSTASGNTTLLMSPLRVDYNQEGYALQLPGLS